MNPSRHSHEIDSFTAMTKIAGSILLQKGKEHSVKRYHPWVFSGAIKERSSDFNEGDWVSVLDSAKNILGYGHYHDGSIAVRMLHMGASKPAADFWINKFESALLLRKSLALPGVNTNAFRLIHGEGDGLSGLIIDLYNGVAVVQAHTPGMYNDRESIVDGLKKLLGEQLLSVYFKSPPSHQSTDKDEYLYGMSAVPHIITEHANKFYVDWETGQKTGFFLDQRENRKLLAEYTGGRKVLNTFCYTGGFSIYALASGASEVHSVDASEKAIALTKNNITLNGFDVEKHSCFATDTFEFLKDKKDHYEVIVLDPPAFAKHRSAKHQAMKGYQRLNAEAFRVIKKGGIIFTFSCSQVVSRQLFYDTVVSAAIQSGREIKVLHQLSQPGDHPVSIFHPEGEYLKGLVLYVD